MTLLTQFLADLPVNWVLTGTVSLIFLLAIAGWIMCDLAGFAHLFRSIQKVRQEVAQLWKRDPVENLKLLRSQATPERLGMLSPAIVRSIIMDSNGQPYALADLTINLNPRTIVRHIPYRGLVMPAFVLMASITVIGTLTAIYSQNQNNPAASLLPIFLAASLSTFLILLFRALDQIKIHRATVEIEALQDMLAHHFIVMSDAQVQYRILADQKLLIDQIQNLGPTLSTAMADATQKQMVPVIRNMSQSFDQAVKHVNEQQQQGIGKLAAHFARQLDQILGEHLTDLSASIAALNEIHATAIGRTQDLLTAIDQSTGLQLDAQQSAQAILAGLFASHQAVIESTTRLNEVFSASSSQLSQVFSASAGQINQVFASSTEQLSQALTTGASSMEGILATGSTQIGQLLAASAAQVQAAAAASAVQVSETYVTGADHLQAAFTAGSDLLNSRFAEGSSQLQTAFTGSTEQFASTLHTRAVEVQSALSQGSEQLRAIFTQGSEQMESAFKNSTDALTLSLQSGSTTLQDSYTQSSTLITDLFNSGSSQLQAAFTGSTEQFASTLHTSAVEVQSALSQGSEQLRAIFTQGYEQMESAFKNSADTLTQSLTSGSTNLQNSYTQSSTLITDLFNTGSAALTQSFSAGQDQLIQTLNGATEALSQTLLKSSDMVEQLKVMIEASQADAQRIREEQLAVESQIGGYFDQMHVQINRLQDDLQANLVDIFGKYNDLTQMTLTQSDEQYQDLMSKLTESSTTLMNSLDDQVRDLTFLVREVTSEIAGLNKSLDVSVQTFGEQIQLSTQSTFQSFDQELSAIVAQLTNTVRLIGDAVDDLPGAIISAREVLTDSSASDAQPPV